MTASSDFDDMVKICEFYSGEGLPVEVDYENRHVSLGDYEVDPVIEHGHLVTYLVEGPDHTSLFVNDLDEYFQDQFSDCWEERL